MQNMARASNASVKERICRMADNAERIKTLTKNLLGRRLYVIHTTPNVSREELDRLLPEHLEHQIRLEKSGVMFAAGPVANPDGTPAGGLIVIRAKDFAEAKAIADSDPFHKSGLRSYSLRSWTVNEGSYGLRVNYSDQTVTIE
jgi:uncharacterized protein YciI